MVTLLLLLGTSAPAKPASVIRTLERVEAVTFSGAGDTGRGYWISERSDYASRSFVAEVTATVKGGGGPGIAFFGMGVGKPDPAHWHEPCVKPCIYASFAPSNFAGGVFAINEDGKQVFTRKPGFGDGTHHVRFTWDATKQTGEFEASGDVASVIGSNNGFNANNSHLFFGGAAGVRFGDFSVRDATDEELAAIGMRGKWLPRQRPSGNQLAGFRLLACQYDGSRSAELRNIPATGLQPETVPFRLKGGATSPPARQKYRGEGWQCSIDTAPVGDDATDLAVTFRRVQGASRSAGVAVAFDFFGWSTNNYVMIPAAVYNGNRCKIVNRGYAQGLERKYLYQPRIPLMSVPIAQLSPDAGTSSRLELTTCNAATPAMCWFSPERKRAFILLAEQGTPFGDNGLIVEESANRSCASFVLSAPGVRERKPLFVGFTDSPDRGANLKEGDEIRLRLRTYAFECPDIPGLLERFMVVRKALTGPNEPRRLIPMSQTAKWMTQRIDSRWHNGPVHKFYCPENATWISFGWVGGLMDTFPMIALGDDMHLDRVTKTFDFAIPRAQGAAGYFYGALNHDGKCFSRDGFPELAEIALTRKNADVLLWMLKQFMLLKAQDRTDAIKPEWEQSIRRLADAFVSTWEKHGEWGSHVDIRDGRVAVYTATGGPIAIGGLALASQYYGKPAYLATAKQAADFYYQRHFVTQGQTTGGVADTLMNADSESAAGFMTGLMALYEVIGEGKWLEMSRNLANLVTTWTTSYDYQLPPHTELARAGARLTGIYWASTQNKHGAPGICTQSGLALLKIYRATGARRYAELLRDIVRCHAESIRPGGFTNERLTYCDADPHRVGNRGKHVTGWNELNGFLMALEIPGIYVRTDTGELVVFDHVKVNVIAHDGQRATLKITNPTPHDAEVTVLAESGDGAAKPLGYTAFLEWPRIIVAAGQTVERVFPVGRVSDGINLESQPVGWVSPHRSPSATLPVSLGASRPRPASPAPDRAFRRGPSRGRRAPPSRRRSAG